MLNLYRSYAASRVRRGRGAFDLTELALYLVAGIILLIGIIALFSNVFGSSKTVEAQNEFNDIVTEARSLYSSQSSYSTISTAVMINSGGLSQSWINGATIVNPFKGTITLAPAGIAFNVTDSNISQAACIAIVTEQQGSDVIAVNINNAGGVAPPVSASAATAACNAAGNTNSVSVNLD